MLLLTATRLSVCHTHHPYLFTVLLSDVRCTLTLNFLYKVVIMMIIIIDRQYFIPLSNYD